MPKEKKNETSGFQKSQLKDVGPKNSHKPLKPLDWYIDKLRKPKGDIKCI